MKQGMEMKVNRLPMRTWNWLHMNDSSLSDIDTEIYGKNMVSCNPQFTLPGQGVSCIRGMSAGTLESGFQEIPTGMGPDMDEFVRESETPMDIFRIKRGAHPEEALRLSWQYKQGENSLHAGLYLCGGGKQHHGTWKTFQAVGIPARRYPDEGLR